LLLGWVAQRVGAPVTIASGAAICLIAAAVFGRKLPDFRAQVGPIYRQLGIIPEVATGIQAATTHATEEPG
jgi:hypothetical protein